MSDKIRIQYVTTDGEVFGTRQLADTHQATLLTTEQQEKIKRVERAVEAYVTKDKRATTRGIIKWLAENWDNL